MFPWKKWVLMIYEINHIWTAEMKWKWRNDRHSERNLCNSVKKPEKNSGLQRGLNPWPRDTGAMLYQLSYKATDVGSRSIVGSYVSMKEMSVNDKWNKSYMNFANEMKMKKWSAATGCSSAHVISPLVLLPDFTPTPWPHRFFKAPLAQTPKICGPPPKHLYTPFSILNELSLIHVLSIQIIIIYRFSQG